MSVGAGGAQHYSLTYYLKFNIHMIPEDSTSTLIASVQVVCKGTKSGSGASLLPLGSP